MKRKSLLALAVISVVSSNAFSFELTHGKLLEHKEWATKNVKFFVTDNAIDKSKSSQLLQQAKNSQGGQILISANASVQPAYSMQYKAGEVSSISGQTMLNILNLTSQTKVYEVTEELCTVAGSAGHVCVHSTNKLSLEPGGSLLLSQSPRVNYTFDKEGFYKTQIFLGVMQEREFGQENEIFSAQDDAYINVTAANKS